MSPAALVWDDPSGYHKSKIPVPAENWAFRDTSTQSAPKTPLSPTPERTACQPMETPHSLENQVLPSVVMARQKEDEE